MKYKKGYFDAYMQTKRFYIINQQAIFLQGNLVFSLADINKVML